MGMFDNVIISKSLLPLSEEENLLLPKNEIFQTKDFDCMLTNIYIRDDGALEMEKFEYEQIPKEERPYPEEMGIRGLFGSIKKVNERYEILKYDGKFEFYTFVNDTFFEFEAEYTDGKLVEIKKINRI